MSTPLPGADWARTEVGQLAVHPTARALAGRYCAPNSLGITPEQVYAEALANIWRRQHETEIHDADGYVRSRLAFAYKGLRRRLVTIAKRELPVDPVGLVPGAEHDDEAHARRGVSLPSAALVVEEDPIGELADREWIRAVQIAVTRRVSELGSRDEQKARALSAVLALLAIAANGGRLPAVVPDRSERLEDGEIDLLAATWLADPGLRMVADGPDSAAIRQRRKRLVDAVRSEYRTVVELAGDLDDEPVAA